MVYHQPAIHHMCFPDNLWFGLSIPEVEKLPWGDKSGEWRGCDREVFLPTEGCCWEIHGIYLGQS